VADPGADRFGASVLLAGAGKMGGALLRAWLAQGYDPRKIHVAEPNPSPDIRRLKEASGFALRLPLESPQVLVLAMKPQSLDGAAAGLAPLVRPGTLIVSILAGKTLANLAQRFAKAAAIVRAMPNLPAAVGRGITVLAANAAVTPAQRDTAEALLTAAGQAEWLADESWIDAATAVSGSGPAYVFYLTEALARAGEEAGLPAALAGRLARATVEGAGELLFQSPASSAAQLRESVTSPGGTTAAALAVLMAQDGLAPLIMRAVKAAKDRAATLSG
jgi:pyrroline-5-carboxylate reductase